MKKPKIKVHRCSYCKYVYNQSVVEMNLWKTFFCENCGGKLVVRDHYGNICIEKRSDRLTYLKNEAQFKEDCRYMDKIAKECIFKQKKDFNQELAKQFCGATTYRWTEAAREEFVKRVSVLVQGKNISKYFRKNGGSITFGTIKYYINK
jgi:hypothetical protein